MKFRPKLIGFLPTLILMMSSVGEATPGEPLKVPLAKTIEIPADGSDWSRALADARIAVSAADAKQNLEPWRKFEAAYPLLCDWLQQDLPGQDDDLEKILRFLKEDPAPEVWQAMIARVRTEIGGNAAAENGIAGIETYVRACRQRRRLRLAPLAAAAPQVVFTKHADIGAHFSAGWTHYAFNEALSESTAWNIEWQPGSALCLLTVGVDGVSVQTLLESADGMIRDPDVSYDGKRILFAWKKSLKGDDYHLYEMDAASHQIRQLTAEKGQADYEPTYLPDGGILFNSTRCVQMVDCWSTPVSNLYRCDAEGRDIRRLTFDQVHDNYPRVLGDGRIIYTRWEYNDRGQIWPQPLFVMHPDGTGQTAYYGGNSYFPTSLLHARPLPASTQVIAIASGHHTGQLGRLVLVDVNRGTQEAAGITFLAPVRQAVAIRQDRLGQDGDLFCHPYPLDQETFLVGYSASERLPKGIIRPARRMSLFLVKADGRRELLARDRQTSCNQPVPLAARTPPPVISSQVDGTKKTGQYYLQDIYAGPGLRGVERGTVKRLRAVAVDYRAAGIGRGNQIGKAGNSAVCTPVAINTGSWDVKRVLGEVDVDPDGSVVFEVPARTPMYFQAIDERGYVVQTMRSWSTLQPGENLGCVGCHETKHQTPAITQTDHYSGHGVQALRPFYGPARGFSFIKEIQPILDRHCINCHWDTAAIPKDLRGKEPPSATQSKEQAFSLRSDLRQTDGNTKRLWSDGYLALVGRSPQWGPKVKGIGNSNATGTDLVNWISAQSEPTPLPPYTAGAATSRLMKLLAGKHKGVELAREELDKIACWIDLCVPYCGDYREANDWSQKDVEAYEYYLRKRAELATE